MDEAGNRQAFLIQEHYCTVMGAPITARLCAALARCLDRDSRTGRRILDWPGGPTRDAVPLRLVGGLHSLALADKDAGLSALFSGAITQAGAVEATLSRVLAEQDTALLPWLDGPPQTNEPGRSGPLMVGLLEIARRHGPRIEVIEIGSSAGLNLLIDRYRFDLGGVAVGPPDAPVLIRPEWRGAPPAAVPVDIVSTRGCDVQPIDAADPAACARLLAYVWADNPERSARLKAAIAMLRVRPVRLEQADAAAFVAARLAEPQREGVTRVLMHSVVWQYLPDAVAARVEDAMSVAGARATAARPLTWVRMEPDRKTARQEVSVRSWPGSGGWTKLAHVQAHGSWVDSGIG